MSSAAKLERGVYGPAAYTFFLVVSAYCLYEMRVRTQTVLFSQRLEDVVQAGRYPEAPDIPIRKEYTGIVGLDLGIAFLVTAFLPSGAGFKPEYQILQAYFLVSFFPFIPILTVEAGRRGMKNTWIYFTSIWALFYQTVAGAAILPIYFLLFLRDTSKLDRLTPEKRRLDLNYAKALIPSVVIGYLLPTVAAYVPFTDPDFYVHQGIIGLWQFSPLIVNLLLLIFSTVFSLVTSSSRTKDTRSLQQDATYVKNLYLLCMLVSAAAHSGMLYSCSLQPKGFSDTLYEVLVIQPSKFYSPLESDVLHHIFLVDLYGIGSTAFLWAFMVAYDTKLLGLTEVNMPLFVLTSLLASIVVGPAAVISYIWWWREDKIRIQGKPKAA